MNVAFPLDALATPLIRLVDTPSPIPNVNTLKKKDKRRNVKISASFYNTVHVSYVSTIRIVKLTDV